MPGGFPASMDLCNANDQGTDSTASRGTAVVCANGSYGTYAQLVASTPSDTSWVLVFIEANGSSLAKAQSSFNIAVGAAASEVVIASDLILYAPRESYYSACYSFPMNIPAGTRIAVAGSCPGGTDTYYVSVVLLDGAFQQMEGCAGVDSIGVSSSVGTSVTTGAANTKGSYSQLTASSSRDYMGFILQVDGLDSSSVVTGNNAIMIDVAIGAAAGEVVILPNYKIAFPYSSAGGTPAAITGVPSSFLPISIPAGTRIAARAQDILGARSYGISLYGIYQ